MAKGNPFRSAASMAAKGPLSAIAAGIKARGTQGVFAAKAKRAGMSTAAYAAKMDSAKGPTGRQARLAETFAKHRPK